MLLLHDNGLHCLVERYRTYSSWCFELSLKSKTAHSLFYPPPWFFCLGFSVNVWLLELHAGGDPPKLEYALHATSHCLGVIHNSLCLTYASIIKSKSLETLVIHSSSNNSQLYLHYMMWGDLSAGPSAPWGYASMPWQTSVFSYTLQRWVNQWTHSKKTVVNHIYLYILEAGM